jgi:galactokinase
MLPDAAAGLHWRISMAKALLGHLGGPDPRLLSEMRRLQQRVRDLENECLRLQTANDMLNTHDLNAHDELLALSVSDVEPAYS